MPLYDTTTFHFHSTAHLLDVIEGNDNGYLYTRYGMNPSIKALESKLAVLDEAEQSLAFCSGMAAISALFLAYGRQDIICIGDVYGGTLQLLTQQLPSLGITVNFVETDKLDKFEILLKEGAGLVFFETPANPTLNVLDIAAISEAVHRYNALLAVDNTFASPVNQKPLVLGADFSLQSATKFLGGHSDLTAGVISGRAEHLNEVDTWRKNLGQTIAPEIAHKLSRSLGTLSLRIARHNENALAIAQYLDGHPFIKKVFYPGLMHSKNHDIAKRQMSGFGGMLSFEVDGTGESATRLVDNLRLFTLAPSLGGVESLVTQPVTTSHHGMSHEQLLHCGITDAMVRLSIGVEGLSDLIDDLEQALDKLKL